MENKINPVSLFEFCLRSQLTFIDLFYSARNRREVELPVHSATVEHQRRWKAEDYVRSDPDQGCRTSLLQLGLQEGRC